MYSAEFYCLTVSFLSTGWLVQTKSPGRDGRHKQEERERKKGETAQMKSRIGGFQADRAIAHTHTQSL